MSRACLLGKMEMTKLIHQYPIAVDKYNISMRGVDLSDQYFACHNFFVIMYGVGKFSSTMDLMLVQ